MAPNPDNFVLSAGIVSRVDVSRLLREVNILDEFLVQAAIREPGQSVSMPKISRLLDDFLSTNKLNILIEGDRKKTKGFLQSVHAKAPVIHMSFGADPSPIFNQKLITWLRNEIHPMVLMHAGLQPNIGAGCMVRTNSKFYDFSLKQFLAKQKDLLVKEIAGEVSK